MLLARFGAPNDHGSFILGPHSLDVRHSKPVPQLLGHFDSVGKFSTSMKFVWYSASLPVRQGVALGAADAGGG